MDEETADFILREHLLRKHDELVAAADPKLAAAIKARTRGQEKPEDKPAAAAADPMKDKKSPKAASPRAAAKKTGREKPAEARSPAGPMPGMDIFELRRRRAELRKEIRELRKRSKK